MTFYSNFSLILSEFFKQNLYKVEIQFGKNGIESWNLDNRVKFYNQAFDKK